MIFNVQTQVDYWRTGSDEDWEAALLLVEKGKIHHGLFFLHLALEKLLKAHVCRAIHDHPPRIHDLVRLTRRAELELTEEWLLLLGKVNAFCQIGRYPGNPMSQRVSLEVAHRYIDNVQEVRAWLQQKLTES
ncbi:MAG: HEPN domain-containing protein [Magnetococcales bacterium]|nr:HEPN domain-containing protein [Magnetococcales bacterium]